MKTPSPDLTFEAIEGLKGIAPPSKDPEEEYPLESWYRSVRLKPLSQFSPGDLARACRQCLYLEYVIPVAVQELKNDPLAGERYDGELLIAMKDIPVEIWHQHQNHSDELYSALQRHLLEFDDDLKRDVGYLLVRLGSSRAV